MTIAVAREKLQTLHAAISGVKSAPLDSPASLASAQMPIVLVYPLNGRWSALTMGETRRQDRSYLVRCYFKPVAQGGVDKPPPGLEAMLQAFGEAYVSSVNAEQSSGAWQIVISGEGDLEDSGVGVLAFGETLYHGFEYRVPMYEKG